VLPLSLIGMALASSGSVLELAGADSVRHGESVSQLLTEATPVAPLLPKPCHANPIQYHNQHSLLNQKSLLISLGR